MEPSTSPQLPGACAELARRLRAGQDGRAEELLEAHPELAAHSRAAQELIFLEYRVRQEMGQRPDPESYYARFPHWRDDLRMLFGLGQVFDDRSEVPPTRMDPDEQAPPTVSTVPAGIPPPRRSTPPAGPMPASLPELFGHYRIVGRLGQGGMGSVYLAHDVDLDRPVALKVPQLSYADDPLVERFFREARAVAALKHPNVCPVYEVGEVEGVPYLAMEYLQGRPLSDRVRDSQQVPQREAAALVRELAETLDYVHRQGVIHRDLKPGNIIVNSEGRPIILDFGLAVRVNGPDPRLTSSGAIVGTASYMAPEQVEGRRGGVGPASDVYALGVILYELLTGKLPFTGTVGEILVCVARDEPPPPKKHRPDLDPALEAICLKAMAKKASDRYASMEEMAVALAAYLAGTAPKPRPRRWHRRLGLTVLGCLASIALAGAAWLLWPDPPPSPPDALWVRLLKKIEAEPGIDRKSLYERLRKQSDRDNFNKALQRLEEEGRAHRREVWSPAWNVPDQLWYPGPKHEPKPGEVRPFVRDLMADLRSGDVRKRGLAANEIKKTDLNDKERKEAVQALVDEVMDEKHWVGGSNEPDRDKEETLAALKTLAPERVIEALRQAAQADRTEMRRWACERLGDQRGDSAAAAALVPRLKTHESVGVRQAAARSLGKIGVADASVVKALRDRVADEVWEPNDSSKDDALKALEALAKDRVIEALEAARVGKNPAVRKWAEGRLEQKKLKKFSHHNVPGPPPRKVTALA